MPSDPRCPTCGSDDPAQRLQELRFVFASPETRWLSKDWQRHYGICQNAFHDTPPADPRIPTVRSTDNTFLATSTYTPPADTPRDYGRIFDADAKTSEFKAEKAALEAELREYDPPRDEVMDALERLTARARANASAQDRKEMHTGAHTHEVDEDSNTLRTFIERSQP